MKKLIKKLALVTIGVVIGRVILKQSDKNQTKPNTTNDNGDIVVGAIDSYPPYVQRLLKDQK